MLLHNTLFQLLFTDIISIKLGCIFDSRVTIFWEILSIDCNLREIIEIEIVELFMIILEKKTQASNQCPFKIL